MKIGIITIPDFNNFGNRLQNYALHEAISKTGNEAVSYVPYKPNIIKKAIKTILGFEGSGFIDNRIRHLARLKLFLDFDKTNVVTEEVRSLEYPKKLNDECDGFIAGSDQIWNPLWYTPYFFLDFATHKKKYAYAASFGCDEIPRDKVEEVERYLCDFSYITVREQTGKEIVRNLLDKEVEVVPDPTIFLCSEEWKKIEKKPRQLKSSDNFILIYFLGDVDKNRRTIINSISKKYGYKVLDISRNVNSIDNVIGPSEFLFLIDHAQYILTDSFHACVFSIIFNKSFLVFERLGNGNRMWNRIETLLKDYDLLNCVFNGQSKINEYDHLKVNDALAKKREYAYEELSKILQMIRTNISNN